MYGFSVSDDFTFQAALFYADYSDVEQQKFVQGKLLVELENNWKYKTFVPQRDYLVGSSEYIF